MADKAGQINIVEFKNFYLGGIADSDYAGLSNSLAEMVGLDVLSETGLTKVNQALKKESGTVVDDFCRVGVSCSDGNSYWFGLTTGKVWQRNSAGTWTLVHTVSTGGVLGAIEYRGYVYYASENDLGRWQIGTAWGTADDTFDSFQNGDPDWHPMKVLNRVLYIGDGFVVAQYDEDTTTFSPNALDLIPPLRIKCLGSLITDLLIGTFVSDNTNTTEIYRWNTWSESYSTSDPIPEVGINCFIATDNFVLVSCGTKGNLYLYNGSQLELFRQIKGNWDANNKASVHPESTFNFFGKPLFGLSEVAGNPTTLGLYSFARANRNYPYILNCEYVGSPNILKEIEYGAILGFGDQILVSWRNLTDSSVGVDALDLNNKYTDAYFKTRIMMPNRMEQTNFKRAHIAYRALPDNTDLVITRFSNMLPAPGIMPTENDAKRKVKSTKDNIGDASTLQMKVGFIVSGNDAPEVELMHVLIET